ncbi:hypothetical protein Pcinc_010488 [Petrolisthes cinctipes]|uniref:RNA-directed DNA polymerase n=1 Tax=Petrolisthes cinctipes TaxID=88211 RepID=A0AAE1G4M8_PETCI|nr:hypothetical protein Pcinc_010488 [Petrolisthes cinctipes]
MNHFSSVCRARWSREYTSTRPSRRINAINNIGRMEAATCEYRLDKKSVQFLVDCGAEVNVMPVNIYRAATGDNMLTKVNPAHAADLRSSRGSVCATHGTAQLRFHNAPRKPNIVFYIAEQVSDVAVEPILGLNTSLELGLITLSSEVQLKSTRRSVCVISNTKVAPRKKWTVVEDVTAEFQDVFDHTTVGDLGATHHIKLKPEVHPVVHAQRRVQEPIREKVRAHLDELVEQEVIAPGFHHIRLDYESSLLCIFNTPFGRYRWLRLPFGLRPSPEVFQKHLMHALEGLEEVFICADDVLVVGYGDNLEEISNSHDRNCRALLERCRIKNIRLNHSKVRFKMSDVIYMGHRLTPQGLSPDPSKVTAITHMPPPQNVTQLRGFLSTVAYLARYLPRLSAVAEPLRALQKKDVEFQWPPALQKTFEEIKMLVTTAPVLQYYDPRLPVTLQCDASNYGLGAAILQEGKPVAYASRSLTSAEKNYAQIEKEMLAIVFATHRFDQLIYGLPVIQVQMDHKPLESILRRLINDAPNKRLQSMMLKLQRYNWYTHYVSGKHVTIADTLSRQLPSHAEKQQAVFTVNLEQHRLALDLAVMPATLLDLQNETANDEELQAVITAIQSGNWDSPSVEDFRPSKNELTTQNGLVFKGAKLVIPHAARRRILCNLHTSHGGIEATRRRARDLYFWPRMNQHVTDLVKGCSICAAVQPSQQRKPLLPHEIPKTPWTKVGMDFFEFRGRHYLIMTDYSTNWFEVSDMSWITTHALIDQCRFQFDRHGVPLTVVADSGTQFRSAEFTRFAREWNFEVVVSSPHYHQSNGKAENGVKTLKLMLQKCYLDNKDPMLAILEWRNTPSEQTGFSPAQRMFARRCRTPLPVSQELLLPEVDREGRAYDKHQQARKIQAAHYNRATKPLPPLTTGNQVALQVPGSTSWVPGTVVRSLLHRAYEVESGGWHYKRNRRHLRPTLVPPATPPASRRPSCLRPRRLSFDTGSMGEAIDQHHCSGEPVASPQTKSVPQYLPPPTPPLRRSSRKSKPPERYTAC